MLLHKLHDEDSGVRREATRALGLLGRKADVEVLAGLMGRLEDRNATVRSGAVEALVEIGEHGDEFLMSELLGRLTHKVWFVRQAAASALGRLSNRGEVHVARGLTSLLTDEREEVVQSALESLSSVGRAGDREIVEALLARLEQGGSWLVMSTLATALPHLVLQGDELVKEVLLQKLSNPREETRRVALTALPLVASPGDQELITSVMRLIEPNQSCQDNIDARAAAASLLGKVGRHDLNRLPRDTISALLALVSSSCENWRVRRAAIESLAQVATPADYDVLQRLLPCMADEDHAVRQAAIESVAALSVSGDSDSLNALMKVVQSIDELPFLRREAVKAVGAVAEKSGLKAKDVKAVVTNYMELAASELKKNGAFKIGGCLNLKLKKKPARPARKGVNPFTKEPCVFKAKPASKTVKARPLKKMQEMIN